jgi:cytochrome c oxidase subunit 1
MLFALAFLPCSARRLTGLPLGFNYTDIHLHDSYTSSPTSITSSPRVPSSAFAGVYHWYPKATGRK